MSAAAGGGLGRSFSALLLSIALAAVAYLGFSLYVGWGEVLFALQRIGVLGTLVALSLSLLNYGLRFLRWQGYLQRLGYPVPWTPSLHIYLSGFALTTTPGKAGEAFRGVLLKAWNMPFRTSLAAFLSERLSDLIAILLLALLGLLSYPSFRPLVGVGALAVLALFGLLLSRKAPGILAGWVPARLPRIRGLFRQGADLLLEARACHRPGLLLSATGLSLAAWGAEGLAFYLALDWLDTDVSVAVALFIYALGMLAGALSFLPGGLGGTEAVMISLLVLEGISPGVATAATVFIRLTTLWFAVALGGGVLLLRRFPFRSVGVSP